jgi:hypothetical protein
MLPILEYDSFIYDVNEYPNSYRCIPKTNSFDPLQIKRISKDNIHHFKHAMKYVFNSRSKYRMFCITPNYNSLYEWIINGIVHVYMIMIKDDVYAMYIFKDERFVYKKGKMIESICSIWLENKYDSRDLIVDTYIWCVNDLKDIYGYQYQVIHLTGENINICDILRNRNYNPLYRITNYYYTINYIQRPYKGKESFILL